MPLDLKKDSMGIIKDFYKSDAPSLEVDQASSSDGDAAKLEAERGPQNEDPRIPEEGQLQLKKHSDLYTDESKALFTTWI